MKVASDILEVLDRSVTDGPQLTIPGPRLSPKLYARVDEVLQAIGGTWTSSAGAHVFAGDAATALAELKRTGECTTAREAVQASQFFPTPPAVVAELLRLAEVRPGMEVLEPSAGRGAIVSALVEAGCFVDCVEKELEHARVLAATGKVRALAVADFLKVGPRPVYDRVVMNPPFTRGADVEHVMHALGFLREGGLLVSVMSGNVAWKASASRFRALVAERGGRVAALPDNAFRASGTDTDTLLVAIPARRPAGEVAPLVWQPGQSPSEREPDAGELESPAAIAREIVSNLQTALDEFSAVARSLEGLGS